MKLALILVAVVLVVSVAVLWRVFSRAEQARRESEAEMKRLLREETEELRGRIAVTDEKVTGVTAKDWRLNRD